MLPYEHQVSGFLVYRAAQATRQQVHDAAPLAAAPRRFRTRAKLRLAATRPVAFKHPWVGHQPQKREQAWPWEAHGSRSVELLVQPVSCWRVLGEGTHMSIDQEIRINRYHLKHSCSAIARASEMLSKLPIRTRPSAPARVEKRSRRLVDLFMSWSPRRSASLIRSLRLTLRVRRTLSRAAATSSSMVRVVLTHQGINVLMFDVKPSDIVLQSLLEWPEPRRSRDKTHVRFLPTILPNIGRKPSVLTISASATACAREERERRVHHPDVPHSSSRGPPVQYEVA
jgi:hypothetical protein